MNDQPLQKKVITVLEAVAKTTTNGSVQYKIKDQDNKTYTVWASKSDGSESKAYSELKCIPNNGIGRNLEIAYKEEAYDFKGKSLTSRTIMFLKEVGGASKANTMIKSQMSFEKKEQDDDKWDKISWGKCKHAYLVEYLKAMLDGKGPNSADECEKLAEFWADMSMRNLGEMEKLQYIQDNKYAQPAVEGFEVKEDEINVADIPF